MRRPFRLLILVLVLASHAGVVVAEVMVRGRDHRRDARLLPDAARHREPDIPFALGILAYRTRLALDVPAGSVWAPDVASVTRRPDHRRELEPYEARVRQWRPDSPEDTIARLELAGALARLGYDSAAAAEYLCLVEEQPTLTSAWKGLGALARRAWRLDLARDIFGAVIEMDPGDGAAHFQLALILELTGRLTEADEEFLRALEADPRMWVPSYNPLVVGSRRAELALHHYHLRHGPATASVWENSPVLAPSLSRKQRRALKAAARAADCPPDADGAHDHAE